MLRRLRQAGEGLRRRGCGLQGDPGHMHACGGTCMRAARMHVAPLGSYKESLTTQQVAAVVCFIPPLAYTQRVLRSDAHPGGSGYGLRQRRR